jgi:uncharacterized protein (DUF433 family)
MNKEELLDRIVINPKVMVGKPVIRGTRLTVQHILNLLAHGETIDEILREYEGLAYEDVLACLMFAVETIENTTFAPLTLEVA